MTTVTTQNITPDDSSSGQKTESPPENLQVEAQQNTNLNTSSSKKQKSRHRASVACASCRDRRIRCVVPPGQAECTQCKRSGVQCVIKNDDERRRPISRAYMCSLTERVALLEGMLKETGADPPPAVYPPKTRHGLPKDENDNGTKGQQEQSRSANEQSSPGSQQEDFDIDHVDQDSHRGDDADSAPSPPVISSSKKEGMVSRLLSTRGHLSFDQLSGRLRYFGPTTNCHVHSEPGMSTEESRESQEQARRAEKTIRFLSTDTHDYLMDLFWQDYNSVIHVLHKEAFHEDMEQGRTQFYSPFLHICVLAMGYRFADKNRPDMQRISMQKQESTLHREAKYMLDYELERPGGIPSVVALLLLGDLECGVGRDNVGWLYGGMAVRIAFDIGLHLDTRQSGLPQIEVEIRHMTLWACVIYDKYWALFLGRPTSMKSSDLEIHSLAKQFERLGTCRPAGPEKGLETQIYEALLDLMEMAGKIADYTDPQMLTTAHIDRTDYLRMAGLDREFGNWYSRLPETLRWTPANIATAPFSFFLLHQQYHSALILLHRPFAKYGESSGSDSGEESNDTYTSALSRTVCTKHAIRVARIFWQHRQKFDTKRIFVTGMQHAGTAATALVAGLAHLHDPTARNNNMQYLECLSAALADMSHTYQPAEQMSIVLNGVLAELRGISPTQNPEPSFRRPTGSSIPARRDSTVINDDSIDRPQFKRRATTRATRMSQSSQRRPSMASSTAMSIDMSIDPSLRPMHHRKQSDIDGSTQRDGFIMVTPHSEINSSWPNHSNSHNHNQHQSDNSNSGGLDSTTLPCPHQSWSPSSGTDIHPSDDITALARVHFPEIGDFPPLMDGEGASLMDGSGVCGSQLDFLSLGGAGEDWRDLDGFGDGFGGGGGNGNGGFLEGSSGVEGFVS
ncbi:hypothetical protein K402DRAFT_424510 [Aulographum hederae CBS 113979]|uniref:Zn(2)-C6 fungal-type domain-containing protein n=1 Tax=Aulographum hederae CBS 113979 TaxID=1176131 RepID=A0A6G1GNN9_9PEZI|nr:hypothetical protein K402DRAFT_424510 [Aulographum hederae CBS 113979]